MPTTKVRSARPLPRLASPSRSTAEVARDLFAAMKGLHDLADEDAELLVQAAAGLRLIRSTGARWTIEHDLLRTSLAGLDDGDAVVVEAAACYAADLIACDPEPWRRVGSGAPRRALWLAAMLRLSEALCTDDEGAPPGVFAAWTDDLLYLEFDGEGQSETRIARATQRAAGIEALTGRHAILANARTRRGVA